MLRWLAKAAALALSLLVGAALQAQTFPVFPQTGGVAILDQERLFQESEFGKARLAEIRARSQELADENRAIQEQLEKEELELTELRKTEEPEAFSKLATDFDTKVKALRGEQEAKRVEISNALEAAQSQFIEIAQPIIGRLMGELGVTFILDSDAVVFSTPEGDITNEAIARVNAQLSP